MCSNTSLTPKSVLIVGAGPTGLILGIELLRRNVPVRLIDKLPSPTTTSRAFTVHSRTLEAFDVMNLTEKIFDRSGNMYADCMNYHFVPGDDKQIKKTLKVDLSARVVRGRHPGILTVPQTITEKILREEFNKKGGSIEWNTELVAFAEEEDGVTAMLSDGHNTKFDYMVGCDGARSTIRKTQNVEFAGLQYTGMTLKMMDVGLNGTLNTEKFSKHAYHYFIKEKSMVLLARMGDTDEFGGEEDVWRVLLSTPETEPDTSIEAFQNGVNLVLDGVQLGHPHWTVGYNIHKRMVSEYKSDKGKIFLAGDSAHINSPAGGQGMNTAIQDGFNLGWKLALVCHGLAKEEILDTYATERIPIAKKVLEGADFLHGVIMAHGKKLTDRIEKGSSENWLEKAALRISGQAFTYGNQDREDLIGNDVIVAAGDQAPDILVTMDSQPPVRLTALPMLYYILILFDETITDTTLELKERYKTVLTIVNVAIVDSEADVESTNDLLVPPSNTTLKAQYGQCAAALIRPDRYVTALIEDFRDIDETVKKSLSILIQD